MSPRNGEDVWPCNCIFCKVFVKPLIKRRRVEVEQREGVEVEQSIQQIAQQPAVDIDKIRESVAEHVSQLVEAKLRDFVSRVDTVEEEVKKVREEVAKSIEEIKNTLVDMKSAIEEVVNPFNILRTYTQQSSRTELPKVNNLLENFEKILKSTAGRQAKSEGQEPVGENMEGLGSVASEIVAKGFKKMGLASLIKLVKWVDDMLNRIPKEVIEDIARFMKTVNIVDEDEEKIVLSVIEFVYKARKIGLKINEQIMYIYNLAKIFGIGDKEASEEVLKLAMNEGVE
jgi:archaellum component FlaC